MKTFKVIADKQKIIVHLTRWNVTETRHTEVRPILSLNAELDKLFSQTDICGHTEQQTLGSLNATLFTRASRPTTAFRHKYLHNNFSQTPGNILKMMYRADKIIRKKSNKYLPKNKQI